MNKSEIQLIMEEEMRMKEEVSQANLEAFKVLSSISSFLTNCSISISSKSSFKSHFNDSRINSLKMLTSDVTSVMPLLIATCYPMISYL